jgi:hypothetical protein
MEAKYVALTPYENFIFGLKAKESIRQYPHRLDKFLTFLGLEGTIPEKCTELYNLRQSDPTVWNNKCSVYYEWNKND